MKVQPSTVLISLGIIMILFFTLFSIFLAVSNPIGATTSTSFVVSTTTSIPPVVSSTTTSTSSTTMSTTTTSTATSTSSTSSSTSTSTVQVNYCTVHSDCGVDYYAGTYFCSKGEVALMKYLPRCIDGICKEKVEIQPVDKCHRNESCIPGRKKCVLEGELGDVSALVEVYPGKYVMGYGGYKFRLNYTVYVSSYETSAILLDVIKPDGTETRLISRWDLNGRIDDLEVGIYAIKSSSAVVWIRRT